ncbi:flagellar export protein FliJ [Comamonas composti]|uniref:flagellar export protein FliJ n=1 Tax=Comamonas composti TaxID=408558 RepID=UPI0004288DE7|nr:flagellar export protein FliJ [Comamonas composti]
MSSLQALSVAVDVAARKRDEARQTVSERLRSQQAAQAQMQQLEGYVREMQQRWGASEGCSVQPELMLHQYQFQNRIEHAIGVQAQVLSDLGLRLEAAQKALMACELRLSSLVKVVDLRRRTQARTLVQREQKETDERAALQFYHRSFGLRLEE